MKISARNQLKGKVVKVVKGAVNSEITIEVADGVLLTSIITNGSVDNLGIKAGKSAYAVVKASNVLIAVE